MLWIGLHDFWLKIKYRLQEIRCHVLACCKPLYHYVVVHECSGVHSSGNTCIYSPYTSIAGVMGLESHVHVSCGCPQVCAAVVTCGGLCPGLNDVVQNIVSTLHDYGVPEDNILGIRWGS